MRHSPTGTKRFFITVGPDDGTAESESSKRKGALSATSRPGQTLGFDVTGQRGVAVAGLPLFRAAATSFSGERYGSSVRI